MSKTDAITSLEAIAAGRTPERSTLLGGALWLQTVARRNRDNRDLLDAASGLETMATGGHLDLDNSGRARASHFAALVASLPAC